MSKRLALAVAIALTAVGSVHAQTSQTQAWVARSNDDAKVLLDVMARFTPESATQVGLPGYDDKVVDLKPNSNARTRAAYVDARSKLQAMLAKETDTNVRQDLQIMINAANLAIEG